jgi:hypothetical protein
MAVAAREYRDAVLGPELAQVLLQHAARDDDGGVLVAGVQQRLCLLRVVARDVGVDELLQRPQASFS